MISIKDLNFIENLNYLKHENILFNQWIEKINRHGISQRRLLIITELEILIFEKQNFKENLILKNKLTWFNISKIEILSINEIKFFFFEEVEDFFIKKGEEKFIYIKTELMKNILKHFRYILETSFNDEELPIFNFLKILLNQKKKSKNFLNRFKLLLKFKNKNLNNENKLYLEKFINSKTYFFKLDSISFIISELYLFLISLEFIPSINTLIIPFFISIDIFEILSKFILKNKTIKHLVFINKINKNFFKLIHSINSLTNPKIKSISFQNCDFSSEIINEIGNLYSIHSIKRLKIVNSLREQFITSFFNLFNNIIGFSKITLLSINKSKGVNINTLLNNLPNLIELSASYCDFELSDFFSTLTNLNSKIERLSISGNKCSKRIDINIKLPIELNSLSMNDISWEISSLIILWDILINFKSNTSIPLQLQISKMNLSNEKWDEFFNNLKGKGSLFLNALKWDENPLR